MIVLAAEAEHAIALWVSKASGVKAIWAYLGGVAPALPYVSIHLASTQGVGQDWMKLEDNPDYDPNDEASHGFELTRRARGHRTASLELTCFGRPLKGQALAIAPGPLLQSVVDALPLYADDLDFAGVGTSSADALTQFGGAGSPLAHQARVSFPLHLASEAIGTIRSLRSVEITSNAQTQDGDEIASITQTYDLP